VKSTSKKRIEGQKKNENALVEMIDPMTLIDLRKEVLTSPLVQRDNKFDEW